MYTKTQIFGFRKVQNDMKARRKEKEESGERKKGFLTIYQKFLEIPVGM